MELMSVLSRSTPSKTTLASDDIASLTQVTIDEGVDEVGAEAIAAIYTCPRSVAEDIAVD
jgi:hypothetical protein